jgi:hypothetical protein
VNEPRTSFLDFVLGRWKAFAAAPQFAEVDSSVHLDRDNAKMGIEFWCETHAGLVGVWENGRCLDIDVMRLSDNSVSMLSTGSCPHDEDVDARIATLTPLLTNAKRGKSPRLFASSPLTTPNKLFERTREE